MTVQNIIEDILQSFHQEPKSSAYSPKFTVREDEKTYILETPMPGLTEEDLELSIKNRVLTLKAKRIPSSKDGYKDLIKERSQYRLNRSFMLGDNIDPENIKAQLQEGFLHLYLPKREETQPIRIPVTGD